MNIIKWDSGNGITLTMSNKSALLLKQQLERQLRISDEMKQDSFYHYTTLFLANDDEGMERITERELNYDN